VGEGIKPETLEKKGQELTKTEVLEQLATNPTTINAQLDFQPDPKTKMLLMEFCVSVTNNELQRSDIVIEDIQAVYSSHLINRDGPDSLWQDLNKAEDRMLYLQDTSATNAIPVKFLISEYNKRLEKEGRSAEKMQVIDSDLVKPPLSSELQVTLDKIASTVSQFQGDGQIAPINRSDSKKKKPNPTRIPRNDLR
jgi:hypothetical protein